MVVPNLSLTEDLHETDTAFHQPPGNQTAGTVVAGFFAVGAYVTAILYRPSDVTEKRMPARALGLAFADVEPGDRKLEVTMTTPDAVMPAAPTRAKGSITSKIRAATAGPKLLAIPTSASGTKDRDNENASRLMANDKAQLPSLRSPIARLLGELAKKTRFDKPARVRGVYFSSGTQTGNPVDRLLMNVGVPPRSSQHAVGSGRSYFLRRFFADLLVPESGIASRNPAAEARARRNYAIGIGAVAASFVIAVGVWTWGYFRNTGLIDRAFMFVPAQAGVAEFLATFKEFPPRQKAASFSLDQVMEKMTEAAGGAGH